MSINIVNTNQMTPILQCFEKASEIEGAILSVPQLLKELKNVKYVSIGWNQFGAEIKTNYNNIGLLTGSRFSLPETIITAVVDWARNLERMKITTGHLLDLFKLPGIGVDNGLKLYSLFCGFKPISYNFAAIAHVLHHLDRNGHTVHTRYQLKYDIEQLPIAKHADLSAVMDTVIKVRAIKSIQKGVTEYMAASSDILVETYFKNLPGCQIITGGGGTGKTTTIVNATEHFTKEGYNVIILTPTNKAKAVLLSRLPEEFSHTVLTVDSYNYAEDYEADVLIVDECSMLTNYHFSIIMNKPSRKWTYLVGDPQQLAPVGTGALFAQLIRGKHQPITKLERNYRTEATDILELANSISSSTSIYLKPSPCVEIVSEPDYDEMIKEPNSHVITHTRAVTVHINKMMNELARHYSMPLKFKYLANNSSTWYRNRMIIRRGRIYHDADTDEVLDKDKDWAEHHLEPGFCTTIHTAQGGGWDTVYLVLNLEGFKSWASVEKELLYTAVTRAKKRLVIVTTWDKVKLKRYPRNTLISGGLV